MRFENFTKPVDWLDNCPNCNENTVWVQTVSKDTNMLHTLDNVFCYCGQTGYIDVMDNNAFVCWDELKQSHLRYNKLKNKYDRAVYFLMKSNYGDVNYLKRAGVID